MNIKHMKEAIRLGKDAEVTIFIWGHRGVGKSAIAKQAAIENKMGFIDMRCSQMEASDIRGLPDRQMGEDGKVGRTVFLPPADMPSGGMPWEDLMVKMGKVKGADGKAIGKFDPAMLPEIIRALTKANKLEEADELNQLWKSSQASLEHGILFLDEMNRAQDDVIQAAFQLVLDKEVGQYAMPPGWSIVCAGNYMDGYMVNGFTDPAFLNRFSHCILSDGDLTLEEWIDYMGQAHGPDATDVIEFCAQNVKHLDGDIKGELGFSIQPSRRAWEMVVRVNRAAVENPGRYTDAAKHQVIAGLVGAEMANAFGRYSCPVRPKELVTKGVKALAKKLQKLTRGQLIGLTWGVANMVKPRITEEAMGKCAADYAEFICANLSDKDLAVAFATNLVAGQGSETTRAAMISNPNVAKLIGRFRKVNEGKKQFVDYLNERPILQKALSNSAWGKDFDKES